jgi:uncharacterized protein YceH (UPF0502 family)
MHLLGESLDFAEDDEIDVSSKPSIAGLETRVSKLEEELAAMREKVDKLMEELGI